MNATRSGAALRAPSRSAIAVELCVAATCAALGLVMATIRGDPAPWERVAMVLFGVTAGLTLGLAVAMTASRRAVLAHMSTEHPDAVVPDRPGRPSIGS